MSDTITLGELDAQLIYESGIDGLTGANSRHDSTRRYALINRCYKNLRSLVSRNGEEFFRTPGTSASIPARASGEDWIELPWPTDAEEIISIDVQLSGTWFELAKGTWAQRRIFTGSMHRYDARGEWTTLNQPQPSTTTVTSGRIVIWPHQLSGSYKIDYLPKWTAITDASHVFVVFANWVDWILGAAGIVLAKRDNNKRGTLQACELQQARAELAILDHVRRSKRGSVVARRRDGLEL